MMKKGISNALYCPALWIAVHLIAVSAHAEMVQGPACALPAIPAGGPPPKDCAGMHYVMVSQQVQGLPKGVSANTPDPECGERLDAPSAAATAVGAFAASYSGSKDVGLVVASVGDQVAQGLVPNNKLFLKHTNKANCTAIVALLPAKAKIIGQRTVADSLTAGPAVCAPGIDCPRGFSRFMFEPVASRKSSLQYVTVEYSNWADFDQTGRLIIFYKMPPGSPEPIPRM